MKLFSILAATSLMTAATVSGAGAAITVTSAKIAAGVLTVSGTTTAGTAVKLDGLYTAPRTRNLFAYSIPYHPGDCIIDLTTVGASAPMMQAVVADCGPRGVLPKGAWVSTKVYALDNLVIRAGSTWRAKQSRSSWKSARQSREQCLLGEIRRQGCAGPARCSGCDRPTGCNGYRRRSGPAG